MNILAELNSIGGGLRVDAIKTLEAPEKIIFKALKKAISDPIITSQCFAIIKYHQQFFNVPELAKIIEKALVANDQKELQASVLAGAMLAKLGVLSSGLANQIEEKTKVLSGEQVFGESYPRLASMTFSLATADSDIKKWGMLVPEITPAPRKNIQKNMTLLVGLNRHWQKRICRSCGKRVGRTKVDVPEQMLGHAESKDLGFSYECLGCGLRPSHEIKRRELVIKKINTKRFRDALFLIKKREKIKENQIAERLGLSPEHLSLVKNSKAVAGKRLVGHIELLAQA